jgi:hypothetical protein
MAMTLDRKQAEYWASTVKRGRPAQETADAQNVANTRNLDDSIAPESQEMITT